MNRPDEQISESTYFKDEYYWESYARNIGGIEVCDDETGEPSFTIGFDNK